MGEAWRTISGPHEVLRLFAGAEVAQDCELNFNDPFLFGSGIDASAWDCVAAIAVVTAMMPQFRQPAPVQIRSSSNTTENDWRGRTRISIRLT
jgi:hypothetical protein